MDPQWTFRQAEQRLAHAFRLYRAKSRLQANNRLTRIAYPRGYSLTPVFIIGSFPESQWQKSCGLAFSLSYKEFFIELWLRPGDTFRLVRNGHEFVHEGFPIKQDALRGTVNVAYPDEVDVIQLRDILSKQVSPTHLVFLSAICSLGKTEERNEDSGFSSRHCVGVADGVSAWRKLGIDGGEFARELMQECRELAPFLSVSPSAAATAASSPIASPCAEQCCSLGELVSTAYARVTAIGSSTVLLAHVSSNRMYIYSLGDSQAILLRFQGLIPSIVLKTKPQTHSPEAPFQLARLPDSLPTSDFLNDSVQDGANYESTTQAGDLLLLGSDGLWDNLFEQDILELVAGIGMSERGAYEIASRLAREAYRKSHDGEITPFQHSVEALYGKGHWTGGKPDDITVVAAWLDYSNSH